MFKKSKRNFAQRIRRTSESDDEGDRANDIPVKDDSDQEITFKKPVIKKNIVDKDDEFTSKPKKVLSFHDDDDNNDTFVVKKSNQSKRMERRKRKENRSNRDNNHSQTWTKPNRSDDGNRASEKRFDDSQEVEEILLPDSDEDDVEGDNVPQFAFRSRAVNDVQSALSKGLIPDSEAIAKLKEQRQKRANREFIEMAADEDEEEEAIREAERMGINKFDLSDGSDIEEDDRLSQDQAKRIHLGKIDYQESEKKRKMEMFKEAQKEQSNRHRDSRLDSDDDDDEVQLLREFRSKNRLDEKPRMEEITIDDEDSDEEDEEEDDDDEDEADRWEREQMAKAMKMKTIHRIEKDHHKLSKLFLKSPVKSQKASDHQKKETSGEGSRKAKEFPKTYESSASSKSHSSSSFQLPSYITKEHRELDFDDLNNRRVPLRNQLKMDLEDQKRMLDRTIMDLEVTQKSLDTFEDRKSVLVQDYNVYRKTKEFVANLCNCINDKYSIVRRIEDQVYEVYESAFKKQTEDRKLLAKDYHSSAAALFLNRQTLKEKFLNVPGNSIFDFYDFDGDSEKKNRVWLNEQLAKIGWNEELYLDQKNREFLRGFKKEISGIFEDTDEEYSQIPAILDSFLCWRKFQQESYVESFAGEFIAKLVSFHLGIENLFNNFIDEDEQFSTELYDTPGMLAVGQFIDPELDSVIVPFLIEETLLKRFNRYLELWNPFSVKQSCRISSFLKSIVKNIPSIVDSSKLLTEILQKILLKFEQVFDSEMMMPMVEQGQPSEGASNYEQCIYQFASGHLGRHVRRILNVWQNILSFQGLIDDSILMDMVRDKLARRHAFVTLSHKNIQDLQLIVYLKELFECLPKAWIEDGSAFEWFQPWIKIMLKNRATSDTLADCLKFYEYKLSSKNCR